MGQYPTADIERAANAAAGKGAASGAEAAGCGAGTSSKDARLRAVIAFVEPDSPAYDAGFEPGCVIAAVDGQPVRDIIDWRWLTADDVITLGYVDLDGEEGEVELWREEGEDWGLEFEGVVFDRVKLCRNACTFCFMRQLPKGMRPSLSMRDDDFRLSFLSGTFVTLTNLSAEDEARILEQCISPLRVSLHATDEQVRRRIIGRHAQHGLDALDRLLAAGIEVHAQIVLLPGENDGEVLKRTLSWAYERPGVLNIGIVPLGFTKHQTYFERSFNDPADARAVVEVVKPFQQRALAERGTPWVYAADEFYRNAYGDHLLENLPPTEHYGDFSMFEDGIGIIRSCVDDFHEAAEEGLTARVRAALNEAGGESDSQSHAVVYFIAGEAMHPHFAQLVEECGLVGYLVPLIVRNDYFGGNVDVTGLLCGCDIARAIKEKLAEEPVAAKETQVSGGEGGSARSSAATETAQWAVSPSEACLSTEPPSPPEAERQGIFRAPIFAIPNVIFNDDGLTLDGMTVADVEKAAGAPVAVVSCNPSDYLLDIISLLEG